MQSKPNTQLEWLENNTPVSTRFDDSYFSRHDGREETQNVFISGNQLPQRWKDKSNFVIGELGFGTGLNFLETTRQWLSETTTDQYLKFISFEKYPLEANDILKTTEQWKELTSLANALVEQWPPTTGRNLITIQSVELHLHIGDARKQIHDMNVTADCWYLDGFNPAKNPELWESELLQQVYNKTIAGGSFSTYTSAGFVKRNLISAGFDVKKVPGFRYKRERLEGHKPE